MCRGQLVWCMKSFSSIAVKEAVLKSVAAHSIFEQSFYYIFPTALANHEIFSIFLNSGLVNKAMMG